MLISVTFSKPSTEVENLLGKAYKKIRIKTNSSSTGQSFFAEFLRKHRPFIKLFQKQSLTILLLSMQELLLKTAFNVLMIKK